MEMGSHPSSANSSSNPHTPCRRGRQHLTSQRSRAQHSQPSTAGSRGPPGERGAEVPVPTAASERGGDLCQVGGRNFKATREVFTDSLLSVCRHLLHTLHFLQLQHTTSSRLSQLMTTMN